MKAVKYAGLVVLVVLISGTTQVLLAAFNASPQAWTTTFESDPINTDSIALADDHIRQVKVETRDRLETEMDFGSGIGNVTTDTGRLLEGAARCFIQNTAPTVNGTISAACIAENDRNGNRGCDEGRCWIDRDGADGVFAGGGASDDWTLNVAVDSDADGDADIWQTVKADTAGGIGGTVPTGAIILWDQSSSCPASYSEATEFRNHAVRGADIAVSDANVPNAAGVNCDSGSVPVGCGAPGGTNNYNDTEEASEGVAHTHTQPTHAHTFSDGGHAHTGPSHTHTLVHTHGFSTPNHSHDIHTGDANVGGAGTVVDADGGAGKVFSTDTDGGVAGLTTGGASSTTTSAGGTGSTGSATASGITAASGGDTTGSAGGSQPNLGPIRTVLFCRKS